MEDHVKTPLRRFQPLINEIFERFKTAVRDEVLKPIKEQETDWITTAADRCNEWQGEFKTGAFLGIMNRDGRRKAFKGKDEVNLSAELIHIKSRKLCSLFNSTHKDHLRLVSDLEDDMDTLCTTMITEMQGDTNAPFIALRPFFDYLSKEQSKLKKVIKTTAKSLLNDISVVQTRATSEQDDAYLVEAMLPIYGEVRKLKGGNKGCGGPKPKGGWPAHRKVVFKNEVTKLNGIWAAVSQGVEADVMKQIDIAKSRLTSEVQKIFESLHTGFNMTCKAREVSNPAEKKLREALKVAVGKAEEHLNGPMKTAVEAIIRDF